MWTIVALLIILALLFGIEQMREMVFGFLGMIAWVFIILIVFGIIGKIWDLCKDNRTPEEKKRDEEAQKEKEREQKELEKRNAQEAAIRRKAWRKAHPTKARLSDFLSDHMAFCVASLTVFLIGVMILIVILTI